MDHGAGATRPPSPQPIPLGPGRLYFLSTRWGEDPFSITKNWRRQDIFLLDPLSPLFYTRSVQEKFILKNFLERSVYEKN